MSKKPLIPKVAVDVAGTKPSSTHYAGRKNLTYRIDKRAHRQLKALATEQGRTMTDVLDEAVNDLFRRYGKPPIA